MGEERPQGNLREWEWVLAQLARREEGVAAPLDEPDEATIRDLEAKLDTLVDQIRQPPPVDDFAEESGCRRAIELVEQISKQQDTSPTAAEPQRIGPYLVKARLRQGGMGTVYEALHTKLQRTVAIKVLPSFRTRDAAAVARFEREMQTLGSLSHRNIVAATDAGEVDGMHYLVMEYVDGIDVSTLARRVGPLAVADACEIVRQAAAGVAEAHRRGIIHRDVKPSNLILVEGGEPAGATVKVLDFGLARLATEFADDELTNSGQVMGTLKYMAPEQCASSRDVDARADVYSLGATFYRLLGGKAPFSGGQYSSPAALVAAIATETPVRLQSLRGELPLPLLAIVERMMAKDPTQRFATPNEVIQSLAPWARGADLAGLLARARAAEDNPPTPRLFREPRPVAPATLGPAIPPTEAHSHWLPWAAVAVVAGAIVWMAIATSRPFNSAPPVLEVRGEAAAPNRDVDPRVRSRAVATWILQHPGASAVVVVDGQVATELTSGDAVPPAPFQLVAATLDREAALRDKDLARFDGLPELVTLSLRGKGVGSRGLRKLGDLPALENLFLSETSVGDAGLAELKRFPRLRVLQLYETEATDEGLHYLAAANKALIELSLVGCRITDQGLPTIAQLKQLKLLALDRTGVTAAGVARVQAALPDCEIRSDFTAAEIAAETEQP